MKLQPEQETTFFELKKEASEELARKIELWRDSVESCFEANLYLPMAFLCCIDQHKLEALKNIVAHNGVSMKDILNEIIDEIILNCHK